MDKVHVFLKMDMNTKVSWDTAYYMVKEHLSGQMVLFTKENSSKMK